MKWNIGCSGFSYREWKGEFYPEKLPQSKWFAFYCEHFNTLELNASFYKFPSWLTLNNWHKKSPDDFCFSLKANRLITHYKQLIDTETILSDFYKTCREGLQEKLGAILFQFPPKFIYTQDRLQRIISSLDNSFTNVVEFRDTGWWCEDVFKRLADHKIIFCGASYPHLPDFVNKNDETIYYRFHGIPKIYYSAYEEEKIQTFADSILSADNAKQVYCYFNNTATMAALDNARYLQKYTNNYIRKLKK